MKPMPTIAQCSRRGGRLAPLVMSCVVASSCGLAPSTEYGTTREALCPAASVVQGVDVSTYQGTIDWTTAKGTGLAFAIARISDGTDLDSTFATNWAGMKSAGLVRGAYQFFEPGDSPSAQATIVANAVGVLGDGDLPVTADMEVTGGQSAATIAANLQTWMGLVKASTGKQPMVYTAEGYWDGSVNSSAFSADPLWVANWGVTCPTLPNGWSAFRVWQYSDSGSVAGIPATVDLDEFNGSLTDLQNFAGAPPYAAQFVSQTWPYATTTLTMTSGQILHESIVLKNIGSATWDSSTRLATTQPRDRASPFANSTWVGDNRLAAVTGTVAPGGTFSFDFEWQAPAPGSYDEFYGVVQDGVAWFSDPGQGGPPDNDIEAKIDVVAAPDAGPPPVTDAGEPPVTDAGEQKDAGHADAGHVETDGGPRDAGHVDGGLSAGGEPDSGDAQTSDVDAGTVDLKDGGETGVPTRAGCGCGSSSGAPLPAAAWTLLLAGLLPRRSRRTNATP